MNSGAQQVEEVPFLVPAVEYRVVQNRSHRVGDAEVPLHGARVLEESSRVQDGSGEPSAVPELVDLCKPSAVGMRGGLESVLRHQVAERCVGEQRIVAAVHPAFRHA